MTRDGLGLKVSAAAIAATIGSYVFSSSITIERTTEIH